MATMGEFGSLLQLGFGIGIAFSLFRAPMELRTRYVARAIEDEMRIIKGVDTPKAKTKQGALASLELGFSQERLNLDRINRPFMVALLVGAAGNLLALIVASMNAKMVIEPWTQAGLIGLSVGYYVAVLAILEGVARYRLKGVQDKLNAIRRGE